MGDQLPVGDAVGMELDGQTYLHLPGSTDVVLLDEVGSHVWALLGEGVPTVEIVELVAEAYGEPRERVQADVSAFLDRLRSAGLVTERA